MPSAACLPKFGIQCEYLLSWSTGSS